MTYSAKEQEAINLCICLEAVGNISNHALFQIIDVSSYPGQSEVRFESHIHKELFLIRLLDFAKEKTDREFTGIKGSCLDVLKEVCATKSFNIGNSISNLEDSVKNLEAWLAHQKKIELWLPTLDVQAVIEVSRLDFLKISGNHSKHNLSRLTAVSREVGRILAENGYSVSAELIPLALDDFREHLQENYFVYYGTWLAELVNNVRWGIQEYLEPEFHHAYTRLDEPHMYKYKYPSDIQGDVPRQWYWRLMNNVRARPYHKKFSGAFYLKEESSLEW